MRRAALVAAGAALLLAMVWEPEAAKAAPAPAVDLYIADLQAQVDSLRMRVESLEAMLQYVAETEARQWRHARADSARVKVRCAAQTKAARQCKRFAAVADSLCSQHRRMAK